MIGWRQGGFAALLALSVLSLHPGANAEDSARPTPNTATITPADVFLEIETFRQDLELLRQAMGVRKASDLDLGICSEAFHDVYFQASTLFEKTNRLAFEITRVRESPPPTPVGAIQSSDILLLLHSAQQLLRRIMVALQVTEKPIPVTVNPATTCTEVFKRILTVNRQLDLLLERHFSPSDVYMEVTLAVAYASRLLANFPESNRIPEEPAFEPGKEPADVYRRLITCLGIISRIFDMLSLQDEKAKAEAVDVGAMTPDEVFLVASLVVSQLDFLHRHLGIAKMPREIFYPGRRFPAQVYQRAGLLEAQLEQLEGLIGGQLSRFRRDE
jgi:hypothetical protein